MRRVFSRSTFGLVAAVSLALAGAMLLLGAVALYVAHEELERQLDHRIEAETGSLLSAFRRGGLPSLSRAVREREERHRARGLGYLLVDRRGVRIAGLLDAAVPPPGWREFLFVNEGSSDDRDVAQALTTRLPDGSTLVVAADRKPIEDSDRAIAWLTAAMAGMAMLIGIAAAWTLATVTRGRIERLNNAAQAIIEGDISRRMPRDIRAGEFDRLAETLNLMLDRNAKLLESLRQVSTDIAHDMRTPLARQQQVLEAALAVEDAAACRQAVERAAAIGRDLIDLFGALLRISEIETFELRSGFETLDLHEVVDRVTEAFAPDIEASGKSVRISAEPGAYIEGDRQLLSQLLANLLENGIRHTPAGTRIEVSLSQDGDAVRLSVTDDGPGIPAEDRDRVLRRFARLEQSRSTPGHGLGLSLVDVIARAHQAELFLRDHEPGTCVELIFNTA
jgi:signal transduction histidine kinase